MFHFDESSTVGFSGSRAPSVASVRALRLALAALPSAVYKGDIWTLPERLWLIENEVEGWTLRYPEDY